MSDLTFGVQSIVDKDSRIQYRGIVRRDLKPIWVGVPCGSFAKAHEDAKKVLRQFKIAREEGAGETAVAM